MGDRIKKAAVLTGDVVGSSNIAIPKRRKLLKIMQEAMKKAQSMMQDFLPEIFQGDSFQGYTTEATTKALRCAIYIIVYMMKEGFAIRVSAGFGEITFESGNSLTSDGPAFRHSGRNMEILKKKDQLIAIGTDEESLQAEWEVHTAALNFLLKRCTIAQAEALVEMLEENTQQHAAQNLKIKQPAVQQRLQAAGWPVLQTILNRFESQF